ncbi:hypothetical protein C7B65_24005 [Phormidesmis priestleyi ULC007]|uniref:Polysaccharide export protein n=1 Tax=Phormidesmis priestleyi ULC007 TaxID=1920490 RepID=A0A2T1D542_9CYAN|nr:SLBB domain-containing protein [Phormidesmis priestleyi]PSB15599.1 hypothetical protein C7B65_24005 [Phormidesmis priestleyi ULC007]
MKSAKLFCSTVLTLTCTLGLAGQLKPVLAQDSNPQVANQVADPLKPEDRIRLTVAGFPDLSGEQFIAADNTILLPLVGSLKIGGLTPAQATNQLTQALLPYVRRPQVGLAVVKRSPMLISITGEVVQPGPRLLSSTDVRSASSSTETETSTPITLSRALLIAGGIKPNADLRNIVIRRSVPVDLVHRKDLVSVNKAESNKTDLKVDLWQSVKSGDLAFDVRIYNGDEIIVPTAPSNSANQQMLLASTVAPTLVAVQVTGEVQNPKQIEIKPTAGVSEAVAAAGGFTRDASTDKISLIRTLPDGRVESRTYAFGKTSEPLMNGDLIVVNRSRKGALGTTFDFLGRLVSPVFPILRILTNVGL